MAFSPASYDLDAQPILEDESDYMWTPICWHKCSFSPEIFSQVMMNLIRNPNINSSHLFRADVSLEVDYENCIPRDVVVPPRIEHFKDFDLKTIIVRTMIPRNILVDKPLDQTCLKYQQSTDNDEVRSLVVYLPHVSSAEDCPFYHPAVRGVGFLHTAKDGQESMVSIHYCLFDPGPLPTKLERTAERLLGVLYKHGKGIAEGYMKRVHHDVVLPQHVVQNTYARLKAKYASNVIANWVEVTDPGKHVFEDLAIAAFLIELWHEMYQDSLPGFVDIGCGNGLLVHILISEGYSGWGFDARKRKSWGAFGSTTRECLKELVLIPEIIATDAVRNKGDNTVQIHHGLFTPGTFIISNHADELTPWTPILANMSKSPFIMIPCCSHALSGSRFRAPPPKDKSASNSAYSSLVAWVSQLATDCGWNVEKEMLRIPSTRNTALIGRSRRIPFEDLDVRGLIAAYGGAHGWEANALLLVKAPARSH